MRPSVSSGVGDTRSSPSPSSLAPTVDPSHSSILAHHRRVASSRSATHSRHTSVHEDALRDTAAASSSMLEWPEVSPVASVISSVSGSLSSNLGNTQHQQTSVGVFDSLSPTAPRTGVGVTTRVRGTPSMPAPGQSGGPSPRTVHYTSRTESPRSAVFVRQVASARALEQTEPQHLTHRRSPLVLSGTFTATGESLLSVPNHSPTPTRRSFTSGVYQGESNSPIHSQQHRHSFTSGTTSSTTPPRSSTTSSTSSQAHTPTRSPIPPQLRSSPQRPTQVFSLTSSVSSSSISSTTTKDTPTSAKRLFPSISGATQGPTQQVTPIQPLASSMAGIPDFDLDGDSGVFSLSRPASAARPQFSSAAPSTSVAGGLFSPTSSSVQQARPMPPSILTSSSSPLRPKPLLPKSLAPLQPQSRRVFQNVTAAVEDMAPNTPTTAPAAGGWSPARSREESPSSSPLTGSPTRAKRPGKIRQQGSPGSGSQARVARSLFGRPAPMPVSVDSDDSTPPSDLGALDTQTPPDLRSPMDTARRLSVDVPVIEVDSPSQPRRTLQPAVQTHMNTTHPSVSSLPSGPAVPSSSAAATSSAPTHISSLSIQSLAAHQQHQLELSSFDLVVADSGRAPKKWRHPSFGSSATRHQRDDSSAAFPSGGEFEDRPRSAISSTNAVRSNNSANETERGDPIEWLAFGEQESERLGPYDGDPASDRSSQTNSSQDDAAAHSYDSDLPKQHRATSFDPVGSDSSAAAVQALAQSSAGALSLSGGPSPLEQPLTPLCAVLDELAPPQYFRYPSVPSAESSAPTSPVRGSLQQQQQARKKRRDTGSMAMGGLISENLLLSSKRAEKLTDSPSVTRAPSIPSAVASPSPGASVSASAHSSSQGNILVASALPAHLKPKRLHGATNRSSMVSIGSSAGGSFSQSASSDGNSPFLSTTPSPFLGSSSTISSPSHRMGSLGGFGLDSDSSRSSMTSQSQASMNSLMGFGLGFATNANGNWESPRATGGGSRSSIVTSPSSPGAGLKNLSPVTRVKSYAHHFQSQQLPSSGVPNVIPPPTSPGSSQSPSDKSPC